MRSQCIIVLVIVTSSTLLAQSSIPAISDPSKQEVPLESLSPTWDARLVYEGDVGIWTVGTTRCMPRLGCPDIFGLDDKGRCIILTSYSGKWTPFVTVQDQAWLGALVNVDLDPKRIGKEMYTGGKNGNLYQIQARPRGGFDCNMILNIPGEEIHTLVAGDLLPSRPGNELLLFTRTGQVMLIQPTDERGVFSSTIIDQMPGRIRQALILPTEGNQAPWIAATGRYGKVELIRLTEQGLETRTIIEEPMGFGRIAMAKNCPVNHAVLYVTRDDGVILRLEQSGETWKREVVYCGPQGPRGVIAGRFFEEPEIESIAVFGYGKKVQLLARRPGEPWKVTSIYKAVDKGHWLSTVELDGRNTTDEIIGSGYGKQIFLLSRKPGFGMKGVAIDPDLKDEEVEKLKNRKHEKETEKKKKRVKKSAYLRLGVSAGPTAATELTPLRYDGGFETKTMIYETLVRRNQEGRIVPALASSFRF